MKFYIKDKKRRKEEFQFFMHDFIDVCKESGIEPKPDILPSYRFHIRAFLRSILHFLFRIRKKMGIKQPHKQAIIVACNGDCIIDNSFPYFINSEIIPMVWDIWPPSLTNFYRDIYELNCKIIFVTVRSIADNVNKEGKIKAYWIPEGIKISLYKCGLPLEKRKNDIFEMGRQHLKYHNILEAMNKKGMIQGYLTSDSANRGKNWLPFKQLINEMPKYKIMICFPRCDTNPKANGVETLTQRYWEAMLSRCLIIGRAPKELADLCGYNPVIDVDWEKPQNQLKLILNNIGSYQQLVDRNYQYAKNHSDWKERVKKIKKVLMSEGYNI